MLKEIYQRDNSRKSYPCKSSYMCLRTVEVEYDGVLVKRSRFVEYDPVDDDKQFKSSDFEIGNIMSVGAYQMLKPVMLSNTDVAGSASAFDSLYQKLSQNEQAVETSS